MMLNIVNIVPCIHFVCGPVQQMASGLLKEGGERQPAALFRLQNLFMAATGRPQGGRWPYALGFAHITRWPRAQAGTRQVAEA
jgi:hypothetical protein